MEMLCCHSCSEGLKKEHAWVMCLTLFNKHPQKERLSFEKEMKLESHQLNEKKSLQAKKKLFGSAYVHLLSLQKLTSLSTKNKKIMVLNQQRGWAVTVFFHIPWRVVKHI